MYRCGPCRPNGRRGNEDIEGGGARALSARGPPVSDIHTPQEAQKRMNLGDEFFFVPFPGAVELKVEIAPDNHRLAQGRGRQVLQERLKHLRLSARGKVQVQICRGGLPVHPADLGGQGVSGDELPNRQYARGRGDESEEPARQPLPVGPDARRAPARGMGK